MTAMTHLPVGPRRLPSSAACANLRRMAAPLMSSSSSSSTCLFLLPRLHRCQSCLAPCPIQHISV